MASIITATTTSGLTHSADNSGVLQLASGTGNLVTVPSVTGTAMVSGNMPAFSAFLNVAQSISNATFTKINFDTETFDTNNNFASSRFTPTVAGYYQVNYNVGLLITAGVVGLFLYKNGSPICNGSYVAGSANIGGATWVIGSNLVYMNGSTEFLEVYVYQTSGGSSNTSTGQNGVSFNGALVRAA